MLDQETKRRIDSARQVLVGKVPDPKAQVEQITTALIYKFMHDMDGESEELGGKPRFFTNGYSRYAWSKLMDPKLGGHDRLNLYSEAITKFSEHSKIPQLFRDIFKDAFLPYRDPETLGLFLKEINGFEYDHSERLGDAFEYLLSVLGSQGDAGQFRTPRHVINFIVEAVDPKKNETVLDPACGTAGFLISAYKHILKSNFKNKPGDKLSPDEKKKLMTHFEGYDISPDMVKLSLVNMYLHSFPSPNIHEYDTLTSEERWDDTYDVILANPPFMSPKGGIRPHKRFSVQANRSEVLFVDYICEHLNINGRAGIIVPEGIVFQSANAYKALRKMLIEEGYLYAVVSLPAGAFNPYSGVKTCILLIDKVLANKTDSVLFTKVENDGFDLGAQRREIDKNDLPDALRIIKAFQENKKIGKSDTIAQIVSKKKIAKSDDYSLSGDRYREVFASGNAKWPSIQLGEIAEVISGQSPEGKFYNELGNGTPFYQGKTEFGNIYVNKPTCWTTQITKIAKRNDILMSVRAPVGPVNFATQEICIGRGLAAIRPKEKVDGWFLFYYLKSIESLIKGNGGAVFDSINRGQIEKIIIPFPPLKIQKEIVEQIETKQQAIEHAKEIIKNLERERDAILDGHLRS